MGWFLAIVLAAAAFAIMAFVLRAPRRGWEAIGAALLLGIAGYGLQAHASLAGSPRQPAERDTNGAAALVEVRQALAGRVGPSGDSWTMIADGLARHGQYADAAGVLLGAVEHNPGNGEAWLALANALVGHAEGTLTPAALYAYRHAAHAAPDQPGPPFFLGLALAQSGRFGEARAQWAGLLARTPADTPWRADLAARLQLLDALVAAQQRAQQGAR